MYEAFYGLKTRPFAKTPDPRFLFMSRAHEEALARLHFAVEEREIVLLTGEIGCGKTTLTRALMDSLDETYRVITIVNPRLTSFDFVKTICARLDCQAASPAKSDILDAIYAKVYDDFTRNVTPVVIIDEAHLIPYKETFEEIRLLTNFQMDDKNLLSLILVGQPALRKILSLPSLRAFRQRIALSFHLSTIGEDEIKAYIEHRVSVSGRTAPLFSDRAITLLYFYSKGIPRVINNLSHMSLLEGFARDASVIDEEMVRTAAQEIGLNGYRKTEKEG